MTEMKAITFACGHTEDRDLSNKAPEDRKSFAKWLSGQDCGTCYYEANKNRLQAQSRREWIREQNKEIEADIQEQRLPELGGSEKQVPWAKRIRFEKLRAAYEEAVENEGASEDAFETRFIEPARLITSAKWWIDHREEDAAAIPELIAEALSNEDDAVSENPF